MRVIVVFILVALFGFHCFSQTSSQINWKTWQELENAYEQDPKPIFIFFEADWCAYCKKIKREILTKKEVVQKLNSNYYALKMDVETQDTIVFDNVTFTNQQALTKRNGVHELPLLLASRKDTPFSLPASLIFDENFKFTKRIFKYYTSEELLNFL